jgi:hypothetical protein
LGDTNIGAPYEFVEECQEVFDECVETIVDKAALQARLRG